MSTKIFSKSAIIVAAVGVVTLGVGNYVWTQEHRPKVLEIYVFALKSGRSVFIRTPEDKRILIDGGANSDVVREVTSILPFYSRRIDALIATNAEGKNIAGLIDILDRYDIEKVYVPIFTTQSLSLASSTDQIYDTFIERTKSTGLVLDEVGEGRVIDFDSKVRASIMFPTGNAVFQYSKASAPELLLKISYGDTSAVLLGNASVKVQKYLASTTEGSTDVLVVSHSALPVNMSSKLIEQLKPKYLVYSKTVSLAGSKSSKKPVIDPLEYIPSEDKFNIKKEGTTHFVSDGVNFRIAP
jgi:beta-lactamase superfamily II metal-dependent hydrolase